MATTTNFGWETPDDTDLVKDGALAIRTLGSAIDTSLVDLKGGTTGQVLSKNSNTDMDFTWIAVDPLTILDAKGDLISATAADTPARLAVGTNGQVLTADSTTSTGLKWDTIASGAYTSIASGNLSGTSVTISSIPATYNTLILEIIDFYNSTDDTLLGTVNGTTGIYSNSVAFTQATSLDSTYMEWTDSTYNNSNDNNYAIIEFPNYNRTNVYKMAQGMCIYRNAANTQWATSQQRYGIKDANAISSLKIEAGSSFSGGTYQLWGVK